MAKITVNNLVSLILEEIKNEQPLNRPIKSLDDVLNYLGDSGEQPEAEMGEMANKRKSANFQQIDPPLRIPITDLSPESKPIKKIICKDPVTGELIEDIIIADEQVTLPSTTRAGGLICVKFQNYAEEANPDRPKTPKEFVVMPEKLYWKYEPRSKKFGTEYKKPDYSIPKPGETEHEKEVREKKPLSNNERWAKYYIIHPVINNLFARQDILNRLDVSLIPEIWAGQLRTERTTNVEKRFSFGGNGKTINIEYYAVKDFDDIKMEDGTIKSGIEAALDEIFKTRMDLEMAGTDMKERERVRSKTKPREYANYIYQQGGNWEAIQRIYDEQQFKNAGEYTKILKLLKQNIQEGKKGLNVFSKLFIEGDVRGDQYLLRGAFKVELNYRTVEGGTGKSLGELIPSVFVQLSSQLPMGVRPEDMTIRNNKDFFGKRGEDGRITGMFPDFMDMLGDELIDKINPDEVLTKITGILIPSNVNKEFLNQEF